MKKVLITAAFAVVVTAAPCFSQVNVEDKRMGSEESGFSGSIGLTVELERGNSELTQIGMKPRLLYRYGPSQWFILNSYSFVDTKEGSVVNEGFSHLRYNYSVSSVVVIEALTQIQYNREQDLRQRLLLGAGLRFELLQRKKVALAVGATGMYEYEELDSGGIIRTPRNSDYVTISLTRGDYLTLSNTVYVQPAFDDLEDFRILDNFELTVALSSWLATTLSLEYRYDSEPPSGIKEYDLTLENGLTVKF